MEFSQEFSQENDWIQRLFGDSTDDERKMYHHWLSLRETEPSERLLARYKELYVEGQGYQEQGIRKVLCALIKANHQGRSFLHVLNCCSYILANYWRQHQSEHYAITELVELFEKIPSKPPIARENRQLRELILQYSESDDYKGLRQFANIYRPETDVTEATSVRMMLTNFPFLYGTPEMTPTIWHKFQKTDIRNMRATKEEAKEEMLLPYYLAWQQGGPISPNANHTVLNSAELAMAFQSFTGRVAPCGTHAQASNYFLRTVRRRGYSYTDFITPFCEFFLAPIFQIATPTFVAKQRARLYDFLRQLAPNRVIFMCKEWLDNVCQKLMHFLIMGEGHQKYHFNFIDLQGNLNNAATVGLLLRLVSFWKSTKRDMERCLARMFKHYEDEVVRGGEADWLIPVLEHVNIAFATNFGQYAFKDHRVITC